ncbi:NADH:flavin oxidoreductase [Maritimibacter sp. 55A14]|uniref:oxidoreductase n=1 Tax=Maritimibacter sp. 55A14 TaxID=2174844 RepID=UPI000D61788E|nr:FAD-dependent oxidoreductase [Maritimibacter sp. 55A14]PWE32590.1 NADH:flavin oxidoreductase [Maritimibacter sp. 55A14]
MTVNARYAALFEPVRIGPVTAKNRFYQVPHCNGMGHLRPRAEAGMRGMKAAGGWGVVSTQETEIHPSSDLTPYAEGRIWDARDIPALRVMTGAVHEHGALAAVQLAHNGFHASNILTRTPALAPSDMALDFAVPAQARAMDKADIRAFRRWHRDAALRAREAGFDIVYVYAGHRMTLPQHFLLPALNARGDEYGGSLENRLRLTRELLEETHEAVGGDCAVAFRFAVDEMAGPDGMQAAEEGRAVVEMLAEMPDLWDVNVSDWSNDSQTTRFQPEDGYQLAYTDFVKGLTTKPVVGVGRLSSPDQMAALVAKGRLDLIGAARPSIADPFLPAKIAADRIEAIRECIGCNICVAADNLGGPIRCTQNPTMGEEWRRGWHPEEIAPKAAAAAALVVGAGPAGLECALQLARRGYDVTLADAAPEPGGRVARESALKGLGAWRRVADNRLYDLRQRGNVEMYLNSPLDAAAVLELGIANVFLATGARWRRDGVGRTCRAPLTGGGGVAILTPDDIMEGRLPGAGPVVIYDDDQAYMGGVIADLLATLRDDITLVTPAPVVSPWCAHTLEQGRIQTALLEAGVRIEANARLAALGEGRVDLACVYTGARRQVDCASVVLVTERARETALYEALRDEGGLSVLEVIGDAQMPGLIADAVYSGHRAARYFQADPGAAEAALYRREIPSLPEEGR